MAGSITNFASTVLAVMGEKKEKHMDGPLSVAGKVLADGVREKCLIVSVDAVPRYLTDERAELFEKVGV